jgi:hypothetical protein
MITVDAGCRGIGWRLRLAIWALRVMAGPGLVVAAGG